MSIFSFGNADKPWRICSNKLSQKRFPHPIPWVCTLLSQGCDAQWLPGCPLHHLGQGCDVQWLPGCPLHPLSCSCDSAQRLLSGGGAVMVTPARNPGSVSAPGALPPPQLRCQSDIWLTGAVPGLLGFLAELPTLGSLSASLLQCSWSRWD